MPAEYFDYSKRGAATRNTKVPPAAPLLSIGGNRLARRACYRCKTILLLGNIFSDIKCYSNYDNDTLCYILTVSYTHLDVYKRQIHYTAIKPVLLLKPVNLLLPEPLNLL